MLEIFHDTKDVFVLKVGRLRWPPHHPPSPQDVEKMSVKKGITLQSVKEVLQSLVDDDLVHQERIGASNFFWSFPSEAATKVRVCTASTPQHRNPAGHRAHQAASTAHCS